MEVLRLCLCLVAFHYLAMQPATKLPLPVAEPLTHLEDCWELLEIICVMIALECLIASYAAGDGLGKTCCVLGSLLHAVWN